MAPPEPREQTLQRLIDRAEIYEALCRYARGVDRGDWEQLRSAYHPDALDQHGEYKGGIDGLIEWLKQRFAGVDNGMHFLGNCLVEFAGPDLALAETYFVSQRLRPTTGADSASAAKGDVMCRQAWGRYIDRFERRDGAWRIARRTVVLDASFMSPAQNGTRGGASTWGQRDRTDPLYAGYREILGRI